MNHTKKTNNVLKVEAAVTSGAEVKLNKSLIKEIVSVVTISNQEHLNEMRERLLMLEEDLRSNLYQRKSEEKSAERKS